MKSFARLGIGWWSSLVIALAVVGVGLDAIPASVLAGPCCEECQDDATDDLDDLVDVSYVESRFERAPRRRKLASLETESVFEIVSPAACFQPLTHPNPATAQGFPCPLPTLLCRLTC